MEKDLKAVDEGGPTREFFYQVWHQLGKLEVVPNSKLFIIEKSGFIPTTDTVIKHNMRKYSEDQQKYYLHQIECYYRAIGRMMSHCLLLPERDRVHIASYALTHLHQIGKQDTRFCCSVRAIMFLIFCFQQSSILWHSTNGTGV